MIAALPMYLRDETRAPLAELWSGIRTALARRWGRPRAGRLPDRLTEPADLMTHWGTANLLLSEICGLPYRTHFKGRVAYVGSLDLGLPDCPPGHYNSVLVVRRDETRTRPEDWPDLTLAVNGRDSQSGWAAPRAAAAALRTRFGDEVLTGAHRQSARHVAEGRADIAAIDAHTWRLMQRFDDLSALREIGRTGPTPGLLWITAADEDAADVARAAAEGIEALSPDARDLLGLRGLVRLPAGAYPAVVQPVL